MANPFSSIVPVLLSGGTGTRLWPLSRESFPKQLLPLTGHKTLLQEAALRARDPDLFAPPIILANAEHRFVIAEQLRAVQINMPTIVLEPEPRNTAPAIAVAALIAEKRDPNAQILVMPADHAVQDKAKFRAMVECGAAAAAEGKLVLFGVRPDAPNTGYGYIRMGKGKEGVHEVAAFVEKPNLATAEGYLKSGEYLWNAGIFLLPVKTLLEELERLEPDMLEYARAALKDASVDMDFQRLAAEPFAACRSVSIDYAVMERTDKAVVVPADFGWTDVGSWSALHDLGEKDEHNNVVQGPAMAQACANSYLRSEGPLLTVLGLDDIIAVATPDAVLLANRSHDQEVKAMVEVLRREGYEAAIKTPQVHRPWGYYQVIHAGDRFQVKRITVNPGGKLSLQKHFHRAEHWVVVNGTARVTRDNEELMVHENESVFLPIGCMHRLENPGKVALNLIEVQSGAYLGEDDIVRVEDIYKRA